MAAQQRYITSILSSFSTFLENRSANPQVRATAVGLLQDFLAEKKDFSLWTAQEVDNRLSVSSAVATEAKTLIRDFITQHPPFQTNVFLLEYLLALKGDGCSPATVRNYRSDINQFLSFTNATTVDEALAKPKVALFVRYQSEKGLKESSIQRKLKVINQFRLWLQTEGVLPQSAELTTEPGEYLRAEGKPVGVVIPQGVTPAEAGAHTLENTPTNSNSMDSRLHGNDIQEGLNLKLSTYTNHSPLNMNQ